jgi:alpha-tubulin suppressor-like RCC1 family protein
VTVLEDDSAQIEVYLVDSAGNRLPAPVAWVSRDTGIAEVHGGVVRFRRPGRTVIGVFSEGLTATITVTAAVRFVLVEPGVNFNAFVRWCGVTDRGSLFCFSGGSPLYPNTDSMLSLAVPPGAPLRQISLGNETLCGVTTANEAFCWGNNNYGQLGSDTTGQYIYWTPVRVQGGLAFSSISAGSDHTCAITVSGSAYCWGRGTLGSGSGYKSRQTAPLPVTGGLAFTAIAAGGSHNCGITTGEVVVCWGSNSEGALGVGSSTPAVADSPVVVNTSARFTSLTAGSDHTCGLAVDSIAYCWGSNVENQVGAAPDTCSYFGCALSPTAIAPTQRFRALDTGHLGNIRSGTTCGVTTVGALYCWGANYYGQIGDGTIETPRPPVLAAAGLTLQSIAVGDVNTCGTVTSGTVYCWGYDHGVTPRRIPYQP